MMYFQTMMEILLFDSFYNKISSIIDKHAPIKLLSRKERRIQSKEWVTAGIRKSIHVKNNFYQKYLKTKSQNYFCKFREYRNKVNHLIRLFKENYYNDYFLSNSNDSRLVGKGIKQIVYLNNRNSNPTPNKVIDNGKEFTDPKEIADSFNKYFATVGEQLVGKSPS